MTEPCGIGQRSTFMSRLQARGEDTQQQPRARNFTNSPRLPSANEFVMGVRPENGIVRPDLREAAESISGSPRVLQQTALPRSLRNSPYVVAQRRRINSFFNPKLETLETDDLSRTPETLQRAKSMDNIHSNGNGPSEPVRERALRANHTGLPDQLKSGIESVSGLSMDDVRVHYNSDQPAKLSAFAYTKGTEIHVGPGQEEHLPHEAWHVVQQAQGRVHATTQLNNGVWVNDNADLEHEAESMGKFSFTSQEAQTRLRDRQTLQANQRDGTSDVSNPTVQRRRIVIVQQGSAVGLDTENLTREQLETLSANPSLSEEIHVEVRSAIEAGEYQGGPGTYAKGHLQVLRENLPHFGEENEFSWLRRITGGGSQSLTGKRDAQGIKTDMRGDEYDAASNLTRGFYQTAAFLNQRVPRTNALVLYRGFTIPAPAPGEAIQNVTQRIRQFSDVLPSSASWLSSESINASAPNDDESAVLVHMIIPPTHPIVIMSYPDKEYREDRPKALDLEQAEVLVGASTYQDVNVFRIEDLGNGLRRYHVSVTLAPRDPDEIMAGIENARQIASNRPRNAEPISIDPGDLVERFGAAIWEELISSPTVGVIYRDLQGNELKLAEVDDFFGYTFTPQ